MHVLSSPRFGDGSRAGKVDSQVHADVRNLAAVVVGRLRPVSRWQRLCRGLVARRLACFPAALEVCDADGRHLFGAPGASSAAVAVVVDPRLYPKMVRSGTLGAADAYVAGWWQTDDLMALVGLFARNLGAAEPTGALRRQFRRFAATFRRIASRNTRRGSRRNIAAHYDLSNEFFAAFLDPTMTYSCGLFERPETSLEEASLAKYERIARKLALDPADHVVEIGCGWGGFAEFAARRYGCRVTGVTISREQHDFARQRIAAAGLADRVEIRLCDYRDVTGQFDKVVSIEMIEAVGAEFLDVYFRKCESLLKAGGAMALQAITMPDQRYDAYRRGVDFIQKYIFPGGCLPSVGAIARSVARATDMRIVQLEDFAEDYARTLGEWRRNFRTASERIAALGFGEEFRRMWDYYLCYSAAGFREGAIGLSQIVLSRPKGRAAV